MARALPSWVGRAPVGLPSSTVGIPATVTARKPALGRLKRHSSFGQVVATLEAAGLDLVEREHREVGALADCDHAPVVEREELGVPLRHAVDGLLDADGLPRRAPSA